jgi:hypothetical protein
VTAMETLYTDILLMGMMLVFALLATLLVSMAPRIADGLLAGASSAAGFTGLRAITHGVAGSAGAGAGRSTAAMAAGLGGGTAQAVKNLWSARAGKLDAQGGRPSSLAYRDPRAKAAYATAYRLHSKPAAPPAPRD